MLLSFWKFRLSNLFKLSDSRRLTFWNSNAIITDNEKSISRIRNFPEFLYTSFYNLFFWNSITRFHCELCILEEISAFYHSKFIISAAFRYMNSYSGFHIWIWSTRALDNRLWSTVREMVRICWELKSVGYVRVPIVYWRISNIVQINYTRKCFRRHHRRCFERADPGSITGTGNFRIFLFLNWLRFGGKLQLCLVTNPPAMMQRCDLIFLCDAM